MSSLGDFIVFASIMSAFSEIKEVQYRTEDIFTLSFGDV